MLLGLGLVTTGLVAPAADAQDVRSRQWYFEPMQVERMWDVSTGEGVTVAVIDDKINPTVPELRGKVLKGQDFSSATPGPGDDTDGHGTNMAILIAGWTNGDGIRGLAPDAKILPLTTGGLQGWKGVIEAIRYAANQGAQIINISLGGPAIDEERDQLQAAVDYALDRGSLIFASAGNDGNKDNIPNSPADIPGVAAVGAIDESLTIAKFSAHGPHLALAAPGVEIPGRCTKSAGYCATEGTSQATALASASAALIWAEHPDWTNNQVLRVMMESAGKPSDGKVPSPYFGYGVVRPREVLLDGEGNPGDPNVNPLISAQTPAESPSPSDDGKGGGTATDASQQPEEAADEAADSDGVPLGLILGGAGVALVIVIGVTVGIIRSRQRAL